MNRVRFSKKLLSVFSTKWCDPYWLSLKDLKRINNAQEVDEYCMICDFSERCPKSGVAFSLSAPLRDPIGDNSSYK